MNLSGQGPMHSACKKYKLSEDFFGNSNYFKRHTTTPLFMYLTGGT